MIYTKVKAKKFLNYQIYCTTQVIYEKWELILFVSNSGVRRHNNKIKVEKMKLDKIVDFA